MLWVLLVLSVVEWFWVFLATFGQTETAALCAIFGPKKARSKNLLNAFILNIHFSPRNTLQNFWQPSKNTFLFMNEWKSYLHIWWTSCLIDCKKIYAFALFDLFSYLFPFSLSILYADIVNFTPLSEKLSASELVSTLNQLFGRFDQIAQVSTLT